MHFAFPRRTFVGALLAGFTALATAQWAPAPLPSATPESLGLSSARDHSYDRGRSSMVL